MEEVCNDYGEYLLKAIGVKPFQRQDRDQIRAEMESVDLDLDASAFTRMVLAELSFCERYGQKRVVETCEEGCHYTGYLCYQIKNCASNRLPSSIKQYAQGLAWLLEDSQIDIEHIQAIIPYTLPIGFSGKRRSFLRKSERRGTILFRSFLLRKR